MSKKTGTANKQCNCREWWKSAPQMLAQYSYCGWKTGAPKYYGSQFVFCPWCGERLTFTEVEKEVEECFHEWKESQK